MRELENPDVWSKPEQAQALGRERAQLEDVVTVLDQISRGVNDGRELLEMAVDNFKIRQKNIEPVRDLPVREAVVGFSTESILEALGNSLDPLLGDLNRNEIYM